jgi:hypothetical protein
MRKWCPWAVACGIVVLASNSAPAQLIINMTPDANLAANAAAVAAFNRAALEWTTRLSNPVTVNINAGISPLSNPSFTGFTTPVFLSGTYTTIRNQLIADAAGKPSKAITASLPTAATFTLPGGFTYSGNIALTRANAKAMGFAVGGGSDATITFNSTVSFDFDNSNGVSPGTIDFQTIAAHEIGHALGFDSAVDVVDGSTTGSILPDTLDLFRFHNVAGQFPTSAAQFSTFARDMTPGNDDVFSDAALRLQLSTGQSQGDGRGASHWKDDALTGTYIGIMDPSVLAGTTESITAADLRALELIGWDAVAVPEPPSFALAGSVAAVLAYYGRRQRTFRTNPSSAKSGRACPTPSSTHGTVAMTDCDGILRLVTDRTWIGTLHGYQVHVFWAGGWCYAVINPQGHTEVCPRVKSFAEGAREARAWVERQPRC